jgi:hypothetical protein
MRIMIFIIFTLIAAVCYMASYSYLIGQRQAVILLEIEQFKNRGGRFTEGNGVDLCESIVQLQRQAGLPERECIFGE